MTPDHDAAKKWALIAVEHRFDGYKTLGTCYLDICKQHEELRRLATKAISDPRVWSLALAELCTYLENHP